MLASLRSVLNPKSTRPDPELDASGYKLAAMELEIKSITLDMVKKRVVEGSD